MSKNELPAYALHLSLTMDYMNEVSANEKLCTIQMTIDDIVACLAKRFRMPKFDGNKRMSNIVVRWARDGSNETVVFDMTKKPGSICTELKFTTLSVWDADLIDLLVRYQLSRIAMRINTTEHCCSRLSIAINVNSIL